MKKEIKKAFNKLKKSEQETLRLITVFCAGVEGISIRNLYEFIGADDPHTFENEIKTLARTGLLAVRLNTVFCPSETTTALDDSPIPIAKFNVCISRLSTALSKDNDLLRIQPFYTMGTSAMDYVLRQHPDGTDIEELGILLVCLVKLFEIFAKPDMLIHDVHDLPLWCGLEFVKSKTDDNKIPFATLSICQANLLLNGFWYDESRAFLDQAQSIAHGNNETLARIYYTKALWHENYGQIGDCLAWAYRSWEAADDKAFKDKCAMYIAYQLSLLEEFATCQKWIDKVDMKAYPKFHIIKIYYSLIQAMMNKNSETICEQYLKEAEWCIDMINTNAPLKGRIYYVKSQIYDNWGLTREANNYYRKYSALMVDQYKATDGGTYIYIAAEVTRLTAMGALVAARHLVNDELDSLQLPHPGYSLSVKLDACLSYMNYYRSSVLYHQLADVYYEMALDFAKYTIPSEDTKNVIRKIFKGDVPESVSGDGLLWQLEYEHLLNAVTNRDRSRAEIEQHIELLANRFPTHKDVLDIIAASLLNSNEAVHQMHLCVTNAEKEKRYSTALMCARQAVAEGLAYDALDFYDIVIHCRGFEEGNKYERITVLLEATINMENCGLRGHTQEYWLQLENMSQGTSLMSDIYQAKANCYFDAEKFEDAIKEYDKCIALIQPEESIIDQRLSSIWAYKSSAFGSLGQWKNAYDSAVESKKYFPMHDFEAFNLQYNHTFFALALDKKEEARDLLKKAKTLARSDEERQCLEELYSIFSMKREQRKAYFAQITQCSEKDD